MKAFQYFCWLWLGLYLSYNTQAQEATQYRDLYLAARKKVVAKDYEAALALYDQSIKKMPYYPAVYQERADVKMLLEDYQGAIADYSHVLDKKPYLIKPLRGRGIAYYFLDNPVAAKADLEKYVKENDNDTEAKSYLSQAQADVAEIERQRAMQENERQQRLAAYQQELALRRQAEIRYYRSVYYWYVAVPYTFCYIRYY
ncbi:MAG TPA: hypothetical protein DCM08_02470 [Microscillaceae bacterium]|nr:hypothetical protein [Microscillaceae bacterium]